MRVFMIAALISSSAMAACPDLSGTYKLCTSSDGSTTSDTQISQTVKNGITTYTLTFTDDSNGERSTESYIADGKVRSQSESDPDSGMTFKTDTAVTCAGNSLKINIKVSTQNENFANLNMTSTKTGERLTNVTTGTVFNEVHNETETCE